MKGTETDFKKIILLSFKVSQASVPGGSPPGREEGRVYTRTGGREEARVSTTPGGRRGGSPPGPEEGGAGLHHARRKEWRVSITPGRRGGSTPHQDGRADLPSQDGRAGLHHAWMGGGRGVCTMLAWEGGVVAVCTTLGREDGGLQVHVKSLPCRCNCRDCCNCSRLKQSMNGIN